MKAGTRGEQRQARTHKAIEKALVGVKVALGMVALLVGENAGTTQVFMLTRAEFLEHLERQQARCLDAAGQRVIADIREAVRTTPPHRAPVLIVTRENRAILQWVEGEPPEAAPRGCTVTGPARTDVVRLLASGPRDGVTIREKLSARHPSTKIGDAITALHAAGLIEDTARRGRWVTWRLTAEGQRAAAALLGKAAA